MGDLRRRFGRLLAAHRKQRRMTQEALATAADLSVDMISRIEGGLTGVRFTTIERLADALQIDVAELFTTELPTGTPRSDAMIELTARLASLSDRELVWVDQLLDAAMKPRG